MTQGAIRDGFIADIDRIMADVDTMLRAHKLRTELNLSLIGTLHPGAEPYAKRILEDAAEAQSFVIQGFDAIRELAEPKERPLTEEERRVQSAVIRLSEKVKA